MAIFILGILAKLAIFILGILAKLALFILGILAKFHETSLKIAQYREVSRQIKWACQIPGVPNNARATASPLGAGLRDVGPVEGGAEAEAELPRGAQVELLRPAPELRDAPDVLLLELLVVEDLRAAGGGLPGWSMEASSRILSSGLRICFRSPNNLFTRY